ncbi:MAG: hypothetical protein AVDCRST_MAG57-1064, partial [uncultured Blastococcus sp.]
GHRRHAPRARRPGDRRARAAGAGPPAAQPAARPAPPERALDRQPARPGGRGEQRLDQLPPAPARRVRLRRGGRGSGECAGALVARPAPDDQLAALGPGGAGGWFRGPGRDDPAADRPARPGPDHRTRAAGAPRPGLAQRGIDERLRPAADTGRGAGPHRRAGRGRDAVDGCASRRHPGRGDRARLRPHRHRAGEGMAGM